MSVSGPFCDENGPLGGVTGPFSGKFGHFGDVFERNGGVIGLFTRRDGTIWRRREPFGGFSRPLVASGTLFLHERTLMMS